MSTEHKVDRTGWKPGPWDDEPDKIQWKTAAGLPALIVRNSIGNLCGYVGVPPSHPALSTEDLTVHGGVTYCHSCSGPICHVPEPGEPDDVKWIGFDCAHLGDTWPGRALYWQGADIGVYRDVPYVRSECESLAAQCVALATAPTAESQDTKPSDDSASSESP